MDPLSCSHDLVFTVKRRHTELVTPAKPTPREMKPLSDIDDQDGLRVIIPFIFFYRGQPSMAGKDPANIIKNALSHTLVSYYPLAGRLREASNRKLMVDCTAEGVLFTHADADVTLDQFGSNLQPPFPCFKDLLFTLPPSSSQGILHSPLLHIQVTRLKCGGFIFAMGMNHTMMDGPGLSQFLGALAEIALGAFEPSTAPVWHRELLTARDSPRITCTHHEYPDVRVEAEPTQQQQPKQDDESSHVDPLVQRSFFIGRTQIKAIRQSFPHQLLNSTHFETLVAFVWRCRTIALQLHPNDDVRLMVVSNLRGKLKSKSMVPVGYYGNAFVYPAAVTSVGSLCGENSIGYAVEGADPLPYRTPCGAARTNGGLPRGASEEYIQSVADLMVIRGRPCFIMEMSWYVSDLTRCGFRDIDFGWGKAVYAGVAKTIVGDFPGVTFLVAHKNGQGEEGVIVPLCLPSKVMKRFAIELDRMLQHHCEVVGS